MKPWIKICGVRTVEHAMMIVDAGATALGLNTWPQSPRYIDLETAEKIANAVRGKIEIVAVTVNADDTLIHAIRHRIQPDYIQCHGDESHAHVISLGHHAFKAIGLATPHDVAQALHAPGPFVLIDAKDAVQRGGTGQAPPDDLVVQVCTHRPALLAGGLTPDNVAQAIARFHPMGVDTASGVESSPGVKDVDKVQRFINNAHSAFTQRTS